MRVGYETSLYCENEACAVTPSDTVLQIMAPASPSDTDLESSYPETDGYAAFVEENEQALDRLASLKGGIATEQHMKHNLQLLLESGHTGRWFMLKCTAMMEEGNTANLRSIVRQLYFLDAACDAANAHFFQSRGSREATASSSDELRMCASMGISMLARAVELPGDPMQMQQKLDMKVAAFIGQLVKRVAKQREAAAAAKKEQARRREDERRAAEREADEERARKRMRLSVSGVVLVLMLLISCAMAFSQ